MITIVIFIRRKIKGNREKAFGSIISGSIQPAQNQTGNERKTVGLIR
ncbi:hypothetical protein [uncultured Chryseobacterium sp.]|nr:hypothetical protein [uncultured Chryseobacterium sp.]